MTYSYFLCLSHDVDRVKKTFQAPYYALKNLAKGDLRGVSYQLASIFIKDSYWGFDKVMKIEEGYGVKSTFFFLEESLPFNPLRPSEWGKSLGYYSWDNDRVKKVIRELDLQGYEIGLHGSFNSYKDERLLSNEKKKLEGILGHQVGGVRQHFLNMNESTWAMQKRAGFTYDSTFGSTKNIGFMNEKYYPFEPLGNGFTEVPLIIMDSCLMSKKDPRREFQKILETAEENRAFVTINWHQRVLNEDEYPGYSQIYREIIEESLKRGAWVGPIQRGLNLFYKGAELGRKP
jgi:hypothetical protein